MNTTIFRDGLRLMKIIRYRYKVQYWSYRNSENTSNGLATKDCDVAVDVISDTKPNLDMLLCYPNVVGIQQNPYRDGNLQLWRIKLNR